MGIPQIGGAKTEIGNSPKLPDGSFLLEVQGVKYASSKRNGGGNGDNYIIEAKVLHVVNQAALPPGHPAGSVPAVLKDMSIGIVENTLKGDIAYSFIKQCTIAMLGNDWRDPAQVPSDAEVQRLFEASLGVDNPFRGRQVWARVSWQPTSKANPQTGQRYWKARTTVLPIKACSEFGFQIADGKLTPAQPMAQAA